MIQTGRATAAGFWADIRINAEFQSFRMHIIGQGLYAGGETGRVGVNVSVGIALALPDVINIDVLVALFSCRSWPWRQRFL